MATEVRTYAVTIPPGTPKTNPQRTDLAMPARIPSAVVVRVPPGPNGEVGWALGASGQQVFPYDANTWIVTDNQEITIPVDIVISGGNWQMFAYNTGTYAHTLQVRFLLDLPGKGRVGATGGALRLSGMEV